MKNLFKFKKRIKVKDNESLWTEQSVIYNKLPVCKGDGYEVYLLSSKGNHAFNSMMFDKRFMPIYNNAIYCVVLRYNDVWYTLNLDFSDADGDTIVKFFRVKLMIELKKKIHEEIDWRQLPYITKTTIPVIL